MCPFESLGFLIGTIGLTICTFQGFCPNGKCPAPWPFLLPSWPLAVSHLSPPQVQPDGATLEYNPYSWNLV